VPNVVVPGLGMANTRRPGPSAASVPETYGENFGSSPPPVDSSIPRSTRNSGKSPNSSGPHFADCFVCVSSWSISDCSRSTSKSSPASGTRTPPEDRFTPWVGAGGVGPARSGAKPVSSTTELPVTGGSGLVATRSARVTSAPATVNRALNCSALGAPGTRRVTPAPVCRLGAAARSICQPGRIAATLAARVTVPSLSATAAFTPIPSGRQTENVIRVGAPAGSGRSPASPDRSAPVSP